MNYYYLDEQQRPKGPYSISQLQELKQKGVINTSTWFMTDEKREWRTYRTVFPVLKVEQQEEVIPEQAEGIPEDLQHSSTVIPVLAIAEPKVETTPVVESTPEEIKPVPVGDQDIGSRSQGMATTPTIKPAASRKWLWWLAGGFALIAILVAGVVVVMPLIRGHGIGYGWSGRKKQPQVVRPAPPSSPLPVVPAAPSPPRPHVAPIAVAPVVSSPREMTIQQRMSNATERLAQSDPKGAIHWLDSIDNISDGAKEEGGWLYLHAARQARETDIGLAQKALEKAIGLRPALAKSQDVASMAIELEPRAGSSKLMRCQAFLRDFPASKECGNVLVIILDDAIALNEHGRSDSKEAKAYLQAGQDAAHTLLERYPDVPDLERKILALADSLGGAGERGGEGKREQLRQALAMVDALRKAMPNSPRKFEIAQEREKIRKAMGRGTLPPEFDELADRVEKEMKVMTLATPGTVRLLAEDPKSANIVKVTCREKDFSTEEANLLRDWVTQGGVVWASTDAIRLFGISYEHNWKSEYDCAPAISSQMCPVLTGCNRVKASCSSQNLKAKRLIPVLSSGGKIVWSLIPFGQGWISDVGEVDIDSFDGGRFWLNFRLFCMGLDIPGAQVKQSAVSGSEKQPAEITVDEGMAECVKICEELKNDPQNADLLTRLSQTAVKVQDEKAQSKFLRVYCLGCLAGGDMQKTKTACNWFAKQHPASSYQSNLKFIDLVESCPTCQGKGLVQKAVSVSRPACRFCHGTGYIRLIKGNEKCIRCNGTGRGIGSTSSSRSAICSDCAGEGTKITREKAKDAYKEALDLYSVIQ